MNKRNILLILISALLIFSGCKKKIDTSVPVPNEISEFIWSGMNYYYLWYKDVENLSDDLIENSVQYRTYLNKFGSEYKSLFDDLLYQKGIVDKWSWITDDWVKQDLGFSGISESMGFDFRLVLFGPGDDIFGYVRYVLPGSPAEIAGLKRGDIFLEVDGQQLNISNYFSLLFDQISYELSLGTISDQNEISLTGETVSMTAVTIQENPVFLAEVMDIGDAQKTGYLVYNAFTSDFDFALNEAFGYFESEGISRLILDLRYNGGGSIRSAIHLSSMIHSTDDTKDLVSYLYNDKFGPLVVSYFGEEYLTKHFTSQLDTTTIDHNPPLPPINSLDLDEVFVITSRHTASASELVMYGLDPYVNVVHIGDTTAGKNFGSVTVYDYNNAGYINPLHTWALQPIVMRISDSNGKSDFEDGLFPDEAIEEDIGEMLPLGDPNETLLAAAISHILGTGPTKSMSAGREKMTFRGVADSKDFIPFSKEMYIRYPDFNLNELLFKDEFK